jgi:hypothetical protein
VLKSNAARNKHLNRDKKGEEITCPAKHQPTTPLSRDPSEASLPPPSNRHRQTITVPNARPSLPGHHCHRRTITPRSPPTSPITPPHTYNTTTSKPGLARPRGHQVLPTPIARSCKPTTGLSPTEQDTSGFPPGATFDERREQTLLDRKPCSETSGAASDQVVPKTGHNTCENREESRMHHRDASGACHCRCQKDRGSLPFSFTRFDGSRTA